MNGQPSVSVIVPVYNSAETIQACLHPLRDLRDAGVVAEIIVVDDGSTDAGPAWVAGLEDVRLLRAKARGGPGAARNLGAGVARGDYLWFVDADVVVAADAGRVVLECLEKEREDPRVVAWFGAYDTRPSAGNFLSQYKNLVHRYYHHRGREQAATFWSGCGVVERAAFLAAGGFDAERFPQPSVEDIDLGYRLRDAGGRIRLVPNLEGTHLKRWRLVELLRTEIFRRAVPWSRLMLERAELTDDLNVGVGERLRAALALAVLVVWLGTLLGIVSYAAALATLAILLIANWPLLSFFIGCRGFYFAAAAVLFHQIYYIYAGGAFAAVWMAHRLRSTRSRLRWATWLQVAVTLGCIGYLAHRIDVPRAGALMSGVDPYGTLVATALLLGLLVPATVRWHFVLTAFGVRIPWRTLFRWNLASTFLMQVLPTSLGGDVMRAVWCRGAGLSVRTAFTTVAVDRLAAFGCLLLVVAVAAPGAALAMNVSTRDFADLAMRLAPWALAGGAMLAAGAVAGLFVARARAIRETLASGVRTLAGSRARVPIVVHGVIVHVLRVLAVVVLAWSMAIDVTIAVCFAIVPVCLLIAMLPISIGGWGLREGAFALAFTRAGVGLEEAVALSVTFGLVWLVASLPGAVVLPSIRDRQPSEAAT